MTNGYGAMPDYAAQVTPQDRWAIVAYIKALQLSQNAKQADARAGRAGRSRSTDIAEREGLRRTSFANEWALPPTAVYGTPNNQDNGIPDSSLRPAGNAKLPSPHPQPRRRASEAPN